MLPLCDKTHQTFQQQFCLHLDVILMCCSWRRDLMSIHAVFTCGSRSWCTIRRACYAIDP